MVYITIENTTVVEFTAHTSFGAQEEISVLNSGSVCVDWLLTPAEEISDQAFLVGKTRGKLLPQAKTEISVFFMPERQGVFTQRWKLRTVPPSAAGDGLELTFVGVASHEEGEVDKKKLDLKKTMKHRQISVQTSELVEDLLATVKTPPATPPGEFDGFWLKYNNRVISETTPDVVSAFQAFNEKVNDWRARLDARFQPQPPYTIDALASAVMSVKPTDPQVDGERRELLRELKALSARLCKKRSPDAEIVFSEFLAPAISGFANVRAAVLQARFGPNVPLDAPKEVFEKFVADAVKKQKNVKVPDVLEQCRTEISDKLSKDILDAVQKAVDISDQARNLLSMHNRIELATSISRTRNRQGFPGDEPLSNQVALYELPEGGPDPATLAEILDKTPNALILLPPPSMVAADDALAPEVALALIAKIEKLIEGEAVCEIADPVLFDRSEITGDIGRRVFLATAKIRSFHLLANVAIVETFTRPELNGVRSVLVGPEVNSEISKLAHALEVTFEAPDSVAPRRNSFATAMSGNFLVFDGYSQISQSHNTLRNLVPVVTSLVYLGGPLGLAAVKAVINPKTDVATATVLVDLLGEFTDIYIPTNFRGGEELLTLEMAVNAEKITSLIFPGVWVVLDAMAGKLEIVNGESQASKLSSGNRMAEITGVAGSQEGARVKELISTARKVVWLGGQSDEAFDTEVATALSRRLKTSDDNGEEAPREEEFQETDEFLEQEPAQTNRNVFESFGSVPLEACAVVGARKRAAMEAACKEGFGHIYVSKNHVLIEAAIAGKSIPALDDVWN